MEEYDRLNRQQSEYKQARQDNYKYNSKDRLSKILKKKVETTMIGALSSVEEHFGFLWATEGEMTQEQQMMYDTYQKVRSDILDKGNAQARNIDAELNQYDIKWLKYSISMPVKSNN